MEELGFSFPYCVQKHAAAVSFISFLFEASLNSSTLESLEDRRGELSWWLSQIKALACGSVPCRIFSSIPVLCISEWWLSCTCQLRQKRECILVFLSADLSSSVLEQSGWRAKLLEQFFRLYNAVKHLKPIWASENCLSIMQDCSLLTKPYVSQIWFNFKFLQLNNILI